MQKSKSNRIIATQSSYARKHYLYVQEIGTLESIEPHVSSRQNLNSYLFLLIIEGSGILTYGSQRYQLSSGDCAFIDCRKAYSHESSVENPWKLMWVHFNGEEVSHFYSQYVQLEKHRIFRPLHTSVFTECINALYDNQKQLDALNELRANKYLTDIITLCFTENKRILSENNSLSQKLEQIYRYIENHFQEKLSLEVLSEYFFISKYHLSREFKRTYGITIGNRIAACRLSQAKSLLRFSRHSMEEIASTCGFSDAGYFIKVFKVRENMTPLEYRKKW